MAVLKCKMCGGDLIVTEGESVAVCEYCGSRQTVPSADSEKKLTLFGRAGRLLRACEFDKAAGIFEAIAADFPEEAEAYWGLVLCRYGIEYVDDPATGRKVPTCHRSGFESVMEDEDFEQACENADPIARRQYREEAKAIEELRKGIVEVSGKEEPYDIFICYKETDENGERTLDSVMAQDVYEALTERGYRVFFSRISLEDRLGVEYEPYIFAALHSAKVMLAFGTAYEYFDAVWVKNEWSRYLKLMEQDRSRHLIPCYRNIDAYDMPKEFARLQAQDLGKVGAVQDLLRGIEKLIGKKQAQVPVMQGMNQTDPLLKRAFLFLENEEWQSAQEYCNRILDIDPENAEAYLGLALAAQKLKKEEAIAGLTDTGRIDAFKDSIHYKNFSRFAKAERGQALEALLAQGKQLAENAAAEARRKEEEERLRAAQKAEQARREAEEARKQQLLRLKEARERIAPAQDLIQLGGWPPYFVGLHAHGAVSVAGETGESFDISGWRDIVAVATGSLHAVGLRSDGTVVATGVKNDGRCKVDKWNHIVSVAADTFSSYGVRRDGYVEVIGWNKASNGQSSVSGWSNIASVFPRAWHVVGLCKDGRVRAAGDNSLGRCNVGDWRNITAIAASGYLTVGLRNNGTVVATQAESVDKGVSGWRDIVAVAAGQFHAVGLKADGTVVAAGRNDKGQCNVSGWRDIIAVSAILDRTFGVKLDGTVVAAGDNEKGQCNVSGWRKVIAVCPGGLTTVGLKEDGTVVTAGQPIEGLNRWKLFNSIDTLEQERAAALAAKKTALLAERNALQTELANLKGIFSGKRRKEIEERLQAIKAQLPNL